MIRLIFFLLTMLSLQAKALEMDSVSYIAFDSICGKTVHVKEYVIKNNTKIPFLTWVFPYSVQNVPERTSLIRYFGTMHEDFNLWMLLGDSLLTDNSLSILYKIFMKNIPPKGTFTYRIIGDELTSQFSVHQIFLIERSLVERFSLMRFEDRWFYNKDIVDVRQ